MTNLPVGWKSEVFETPLEGVTTGDHQEIISKHVEPGKELGLEFASNSFRDEGAIAVYALYKRRFSERQSQIGYVPINVAIQLARGDKGRVQMSAKVVRITGGGGRPLGVTIQLVATWPPPPPAPIVADLRARGDRDYRGPDDAENVVRVNQPQPKGYPRKLHEYIPVAGTSFKKDDVARFIYGGDRSLSLKREVVTAKDGSETNALAVYGQWTDGDGSHEAHLGYVPQDVNEELGDTPCGVRLEAMFRPEAGKNPGIRMSIWGKRRKQDESI